MIKNSKAEIFLTSFLILFLELSLIRYLPANIVYLGYYTNFILLASFVGIGAGMLLATRFSTSMLNLTPWCILTILAISTFFEVSLSSTGTGEIHFTNNFNGIVVSEYILIPIVFILVTVTFTLLSHRLGMLFNKLQSLTAYTWDILGSLSSIVVFTVFSFLGLGPFAWFLCFILLYCVTYWKNTLAWRGVLAAFFVILLIVWPWRKFDQWSPYQKVTARPIFNKERTSSLPLGYYVYVNNILHQGAMQDLDKEDWFYNFPYTAFPSLGFKRALVIGSGSGKDVTFALKHNIEHVDAVEIDPKILDAAKKLNPHKPYEDKRVTAYVSDGRTFLANTQNSYDLIVFGLPDSLVMAASHGNIRLESFIFTIEAFRDAKRHLTENGLLVLYNYYRESWLIDRLATMLDTVFGQDTYIQVRQPGYSAILINGKGLASLDSDITPSTKPSRVLKPASDDWPFLYLEKPSIPTKYINMLLIISLFIYVFLSILIGKPLHKSLSSLYFFMGVAFLLLETKSIIHFSLLFGSTWLVNALVFFAILAMVLAAILFVSKVRIGNILVWYTVLGIALLLQYLFPIETLLSLSAAAKYISVSVVTLIPVFLANIIFSYHFKHSKTNAVNFASNLLGAAVGAGVEYIALIIGYHNLVPVIFLCYLAAFLPVILTRRVSI